MGAWIRRPVAWLAIGVLGWGVLAAALVPIPAWPQPVEGDALQWLRSAAAAMSRVSYEGTRTVTVWAAGVTALQLHEYHEAPDRTRLEYQAAGDQPERIVVISGTTQTTYIPSRNEVIRAPAPQAQVQAPVQQLLPQLARNYDVRFDGTDEVAGRRTRIIDVQSRFPNRPHLRVWVDEKTRLILRFERYGPDNTLRQASAFIAITINPPFAAGLFDIAPALGTQVQTQQPAEKLTIEEIAARVGFIPQLPSYLPSGYKIVGSRVVDVHGVPTVAFQFFDGVANLTLFESHGAEGAPPNSQPVEVGTVPGTVLARGGNSVLHWNANGVSFTLVGESLSAQEMVRVGSSVPPASGGQAPTGWRTRARAWLAALVRPPAAEAAPRSTPAAAAPAVPPVPLSPYMTNDTHVIGPGIVAEERAVWRVLVARRLSPIVVKVTIASDGVTKTPDGRLARLAWVWFVYGMDWTGGAAAAVREVQASGYALGAAAFAGDSRVTRVLLTGYYQESGRFDGRRTDATFTAQLFRDRFQDEHSGVAPGAGLAAAGDAWYAPALRAGDLIEQQYEIHDPHMPLSERLQRHLPPPPGDRTAESAENFHGGLVALVYEIKARMQSLLFGGESQGRLWRGNPRLRDVALTFDDGPSPLTTPLLLSILQRYGAHGTFFVIGEHAQAYPYFLAEMAADGDEIGDHTYHHPNLSSLDDATVGAEIDAGAAVIHAAVPGARLVWFRPPGGDYTTAVVAAAHRVGLGLAMWTENSGDWMLPPANIVAQRVMARAEPGAVILLHNGTLNTVRALPDIIVNLQRRGYRLVTLSQLAQDSE